MEEQILEIIDDEINAHNQVMPSVITRKDIVKRINSMVMEFADWALKHYEMRTRFSIENLFQYWFDNIYKNG